MAFVEGALDIAPVFYISGNHEAGQANTYNKEGIGRCRSTCSDNDVIRLSIGGSSIYMLV